MRYVELAFCVAAMIFFIGVMLDVLDTLEEGK